jgi:hypothetical protein
VLKVVVSKTLEMVFGILTPYTLLALVRRGKTINS